MLYRIKNIKIKSIRMYINKINVMNEQINYLDAEHFKKPGEERVILLL
jgi:hypothetical protein